MRKEKEGGERKKKRKKKKEKKKKEKKGEGGGRGAGRRDHGAKPVKGTENHGEDLKCNLVLDTSKQMVPDLLYAGMEISDFN